MQMCCFYHLFTTSHRIRDRREQQRIWNFTRLSSSLTALPLLRLSRYIVTSLVKFVGASLVACGERRSVPAALDGQAVLGHGLQHGGEAPVTVGTDDEFGRALVGPVVDDRLSGLLTAVTTGRHVVGRPTVCVGAFVTTDYTRQLRRLAAAHGASSARTGKRENRREHRAVMADTAWHMLKKNNSYVIRLRLSISALFWLSLVLQCRLRVLLTSHCCGLVNC